MSKRVALTPLDTNARKAARLPPGLQTFPDAPSTFRLLGPGFTRSSVAMTNLATSTINHPSTWEFQNTAMQEFKADTIAAIDQSFRDGYEHGQLMTRHRFDEGPDAYDALAKKMVALQKRYNELEGRYFSAMSTLSWPDERSTLFSDMDFEK